MSNDDDVSAFLSYRYLPGNINISDEVLSAIRSEPIEGDFDNLAELGAHTFLKTTEKIVDQFDDDITHVVPLSGGYDSRLVLAGLIDTISRDQIIAVTFGMPGSYDYRIGSKLAQTAGVDHRKINITPGKFPWTHDRMLRSAKNFKWPTKLFRGYTALEYGFQRDELTENCVYWIGYLGGPVSGDGTPKKQYETWAEAVEAFIDYNYTYPQLSRPDYDPQDHVPNQPVLDPAELGYYEQLNFGVRQPYFTAPSILLFEPHATPIHAEPFLSFMLNAPKEYRTDLSLYRELGRRISPELYKVPTQQSRGLGVNVPKWRKAPHILRLKMESRIRELIGKERPPQTATYLDWDLELRRSEQLQKLVEPAMNSLSERNTVTWLSPNNLYNSHFNGENHGRELHMLTSLELFIQASEQE